jgi:hypothetical protein
VLQFVPLGGLFAAKAWRLRAERDAEVLAEFGESPAMLLVRRGGSTVLQVAFDVNETNWPFQPGLVIFCVNAMNYLGREVGQTRQSELRVGQPITVRDDGNAGTAAVRTPGGDERTVRADPSGSFRFAGTDRAGVYLLSPAGGQAEPVAVNMLDERESRIAPIEEMTVGGSAVAPVGAGAARENVDLWPLLAAGALALVCLEWFVYNAKLKV